MTTNGMLTLSTQLLQLRKRHPFTISRGTLTVTENLFVTLGDGTYSGIGESAPGVGSPWPIEQGERQLHDFWATVDSDEPHVLWERMSEAGVDPPAMAALDMALWDLTAKRAGLPLHRLLGLTKRQVATSVTIGLNPPDVTRTRVTELLGRTGARALKIKLGSPLGYEFDQEHFCAAAEAAEPFGAILRVDANGGWDVPTAKRMMRWLADRDVEFVEQPLVRGAEDDLPALFENRPLPLLVDESCRLSSDVPRLAPFVDGVSLKLMKCGGITEALRIVATARAHGLRTMIGCMSESSISIAAGASIGSLFDYIDLDSHLEWMDDPAEGTVLVDGVVLPADRPGHGADLLYSPIAR